MQMIFGGSARRIACATAVVVAASLGACGGGGDEPIPPFWLYGGIVAADFDGDGRVDVAVATSYIAGPPPHPGFVEVYLQTAPGAIQWPVQYGIAADPWGLSAGDFDGDGRLDLVAATPSTLPPEVNVISDSGGVSILRQDPANPGRFLASAWTRTGGAAQAAAIGQLTGDTFADVVVADAVLVNARALLLAQDPMQPGTLLAPTALSIGGGRGATEVAVGDLNGDTLPDVALAATDSVAVFYRNARGGFDPAALHPVGTRPQGIALADIDGDGRLDIVTANAGNAPAGGVGGASVTLLLQTVAGSFVRSDIAVADGARRLAVADLNDDGIPDLAVVSIVYQAIGEASRVTVLLQSSAMRGQFGAGVLYIGAPIGSFIAAGDVNGDGLNDILLNDGPSVLLQRTTAPGTFDPVRPLR